jgi:hypothetical protein
MPSPTCGDTVRMSSREPWRPTPLVSVAGVTTSSMRTIGNGVSDGRLRRWSGQVRSGIDGCRLLCKQVGDTVPEEAVNPSSAELAEPVLQILTLHHRGGPHVGVQPLEEGPAKATVPDESGRSNTMNAVRCPRTP